MSSKVIFNMTDTDPGFVKAIARIQGPGVSAIGYFEEQGSNAKGTPLVKQAAALELGTEIIPPRPFLRRPFDQKKKELLQRFKREAIEVIAGKKTKKQVLDEISKEFIKDAQKGILAGPWIPNAPSTIAKKGFDQPLIESGEMKDKMAYKLRKK